MKKQNSTIEITEDVRVPGTDVILEAGDKIEVLDEKAPQMKSNDRLKKATTKAVGSLSQVIDELQSADATRHRDTIKKIELLIKKLEGMG